MNTALAQSAKTVSNKAQAVIVRNPPATNSVNDDKIADYLRKNPHHTIMGDWSYGPNGEWTKSGVMQVQYHNIKDETIHVYTGKILFEIDVDGQLVGREMGPGESVHVTPKTIHRMTALEDTDVLEASTPELDDVVRLEDRYGRASADAPPPKR